MDTSHSLHLKIHVKCITINAHVLEIKQELLNIGDPILTGSWAGLGHKRCRTSLESEAEVIQKSRQTIPGLATWYSGRAQKNT
jgi:hypothetical protein